MTVFVFCRQENRGLYGKSVTVVAFCNLYYFISVIFFNNHLHQPYCKPLTRNRLEDFLLGVYDMLILKKSTEQI